MNMWFKVDGEIDVSTMFDDKENGINTQKFCNQLISNNVEIVQSRTNSEIEEWENYYIDMHPKQNLLEDILLASTSNDEVKDIFKKFFKPLSVESCCVTIIDPYIFAKGTNVNLLVTILDSNIGSRKIKFITTAANSDNVVKTDIETKLSNLGFDITIEDRKDIHDRWWYTRINGFYCGTSFNGISHKTTMLNLISDNDLNEIIKIYGV